MLKFRLKKIGRKGQPSYRVVLTQVASKRDGGSIMELGSFNPKEKEFNYRRGITDDNLIYWVLRGACFSQATYTILKNYFRKRTVRGTLSIELFLFLTNKSEKKLGLFGNSGLTTTVNPIFNRESTIFPGYEEQFVYNVRRRYSYFKNKALFPTRDKITPTWFKLEFLDPLLDKRLKNILYKHGINSVKKFMSFPIQDFSDLEGIESLQLRTIKQVKYALAFDSCLGALLPFYLEEETEKQNYKKLKKNETRWQINKTVIKNKLPKKT